MQNKTYPWLEGLNPAQMEAVTAPDGPAMVLAGAGSGKTRVIIYRIAYVISAMKIPPYRILALTFTNKAADELKNRLSSILAGRGEAVWAGTFHSIFSKILRIEAEKIGYTSRYVIYDSIDQERLVKNIITSFGLSRKEFSSSAVINKISLFKNRRVPPSEVKSSSHSYQMEMIADIYKKYQEKLFSSNAMDFDDLIIKPIELFEKNPDVLVKYQKQFRHILVDEYQDTNKAQYQLVKLLSSKKCNLYVVGDEDQSIYRWRGADITNVLNFEKDFTGARIYRLEQNYRSSGNILKAADSVIRNNVRRIGKKLWTERDSGEKIRYIKPADEIEEAAVVSRIIKEVIPKKKLKWNDCAVFYRTHAQSRVLEDQLRQAGIPYEIVGGMKFYERKEIKDLLAYLYVIINPRDEVNLLRVINYPPRGIGKTTLHRLQAHAVKANKTIMECIESNEPIDGVAERGRKNLSYFYEIIKKYRGLLGKFELSELVSSLANETGIPSIFKEEGTQESLTRLDNVYELINAIAQFEKNNEDATLYQFLEEIALYNNIDSWDDKKDSLSLMTLHSAKGLEFPVVFLVGLEEGLFPLFRAEEDYDEHLEEERRLFYVGLTRGEQQVYISSADYRTRRGETVQCLPSTFIGEINPLLLEDYNGHSGRRKRSSAARRGPVSPLSPFAMKKKTEKDSARFAKGTRVEHPSFGEGLIVGSDGVGEDIRYTILFNSVGEKRVIAKYAHLIKLGS